jgi:hypothetical protein
VPATPRGWAFNYRDGSIVEQVRAAAPDGIDVYFDSVAGDHLEAALATLRRWGRVAMCGAIPRKPRNSGRWPPPEKVVRPGCDSVLWYSDRAGLTDLVELPAERT